VARQPDALPESVPDALHAGNASIEANSLLLHLFDPLGQRFYRPYRLL
jgi:hypothetical protein